MAQLADRDATVVVVDFHSHTKYSHDGRPGWTEEDVRNWHRAAGYDVAYITDHATFEGAERGIASNPGLAGEGTMILQGLEVVYRGEHVNILSAGRRYRGLTTPDLKDMDVQALQLAGFLRATAPVLIETVPAQPEQGAGAARVTARASTRSRSSTARRADSPQDRRDRQRIVHIADSLNLALVAGSDNHGWGHAAPGWTLMRVPGWRGMANRFALAPHRGRSARRTAAGSPHRRTSRGRGDESAVGRVRGAARRVAHVHDAVGRRTRDVAHLDVGARAARSRSARLSHSAVRDGVTAADIRSQDARWSLASYDHHACPPLVRLVLRRGHSGCSPTRRTTGIGRAISRRAISTIPRARAARFGWVTMLLAPFGASTTPLGGADSAPSARVGSAALATAAIARRLGGDARGASGGDHHHRAAAGRRGIDSRNARFAGARGDGGGSVLRRARARVVRPGRRIRCAGGRRREWRSASRSRRSTRRSSFRLPLSLAIVIHPDLSARWREPGPYVACVLAALVFAPVLAWNAHHGWISFVFQLHHGLSAPQGSALRAAWKHEGDFFGGQAGLASPILFVMLGVATARALARARTGRRAFVLATVAALSFGFFMYSALRQRVEPNWPAPAYIPAIVLAGDDAVG